MTIKNYSTEFQRQLTEARSNLDQLEGFQNQELSKVKHMLLSAETALEKEKRTRAELERKATTTREGPTQEQQEDMERKVKALTVSAFCLTLNVRKVHSNDIFMRKQRPVKFHKYDNAEQQI